MIVQWYEDEKRASIFHHKYNQMLAEMPDCPTTHSVEWRLKELGLRRRQKWQKTDWGYEAKICRRLK